LVTRGRELVHAIRQGDEAKVEEAVLRLSRSRRWLAPLALAVGAFEMLFEGLRMVFSNWRLTLVQVLPAMWIWLAMLDLKAHALHGKSFHALTGPVVIPLVAAVAAITAAAFTTTCAKSSRPSAAHQLYAQRQVLVEPLFGQIKHNRGADRFGRRGRSAVRSEWRLLAATNNLLKLWRHSTTPAPA
jgi:Transposase DDE domain